MSPARWASSVFGAGESTFVINTPPSQKEYLQFSVMQAGEVTSAIHRLSPGDKVGVRPPLGNFFPYNDWKGKNIFFVGGGIGMAPIRTIMLHVLEHKADYGKVSLLYGARSPRDMAFSYELKGWLANPDLDCTLCIDNPAEYNTHCCGSDLNATELRTQPGQLRGRALRPADHDQVHPAGSGKTGLPAREHRDHAGKAHEVRYRHLWPLQHRQPLCLRGRPGVHGLCFDELAPEL